MKKRCEHQLRKLIYKALKISVLKDYSIIENQEYRGKIKLIKKFHTRSPSENESIILLLCEELRVRVGDHQKALLKFRYISN